MYSLLQRLSVMLFGIASFFVLARALSTEQMGAWALFLAITANLELIRYSIVKNGFIKYLSSSDERSHSEIMSAALLLNVLVTLSLIILLLVFMPYLSSFLKAPGLTRIMYIFIIGLILLIPFSHFEWIQNARSDFKGIFLAHLTRQICWFLFMMTHLAIYGSISLSALSLYYSIGVLAGGVTAFTYARQYLVKRLIFVKDWFLKLWHFGKVILGSAASSMVFKNVDQFVVSNLISLTAVALYGTSIRIINLLDLPSHIIGDIMFPRSAQVNAHGNTERLKYMYEKSVGAILSIIIPLTIFIFLFPELLLLVLAGQKYIGAAFILRLMLINSIFTVFIKQFATILDSGGKAKINFTVITIMAVLSIACCYFLARKFGVAGASLGITAAHFVGFCCSQYYLNKHYGIRFWKCFGYAVSFYPEMYGIFKERFLLKWRTNI